MSGLFAAIEPLVLTGNTKLAVAIIFGILLGVLLVKCDFADRQEVRKNLTFGSMKMAKTLLLSLGLGMIVFVLLRNVHTVQAHHPSMSIWGVLLGGICCGAGLGIGGLVPVTAVAALASGRLYALWVLLGMALAIPAAKLIHNAIPSVIANFSKSVAVEMEPPDGLWALNSPVLWVSVIAFMLVLIMHFFGKKED